MTDSKNVLVFAEQFDGDIHPISYELLGKGREIAREWDGELWCVLLGPEESNGEELIYQGADKVFLFEDSILNIPDEQIYKQNLTSLIEEENPELVLIGATSFGRSLAPRIATALDTGLTADCTGLEINEDDELEQVRPAFSGNVLAHITTRGRPIIATIRYKEMEKLNRDTSREGEIIEKKVEKVENTNVEILKRLEKEEVNIEDAELVISGGRGLDNPEDFDLLKELKDLCGGEIGSSRPLVDEGWISKDHQVGYSGSRTKPKIYIACGISGAPQHLVGMKESDIIIAINKDPSAPIFKVADYGMVGDLYEILPRLIEKISEIKEGR